MPPQICSPTRPSRSKRDSLTVTRSIGKALADVMNKEKDSIAASSSTESEPTGNAGSPAKSRAVASAKPVMATIREGSRASRLSLDTGRSNSRNDKSTPKAASKPTTRSQTTMASLVGEKPPMKALEKPSKPRASLTLRGLSSALQPKSSLPPSALPKYIPKSSTESLSVVRSSAKKRLSDWDADIAVEKGQGKAVDVKSSDDDADDEFVTVDRPISPLPRRATRKTILPVSLSLTPRKTGNVLHKPTSSVSSTPPRASKTAKTSSTSTAPVTRLQTGQPRPPSVNSNNSSQRATPVQSPQKPPSSSHAKTTPSTRSMQKLSALADSSMFSGSKLEGSSPATPFQLPETSGSSLLSPPLSPYLDGVSIDSIDANDVSALLSTVVSPTKFTPAPSRTIREAPPQTPRDLHVLPEESNSPPPQTPVSTRTNSTLTTDPRQSALSLRQFLENSADLEHLLSQPLPSLLTPDARERLLSFGFSPGLSPLPFPSAAVRPEPQTPSPVPDGQRYTSISQVLFPNFPAPLSAEQQCQPVPDSAADSQTPRNTDLDGNLVEMLKRELTTIEIQCTERDARIESLEKQLSFLRMAREREAAELSTQVTDLEAKLQGLLGDREQETERRAKEIEERLRDKDAEWERLVITTVARVQEQDLVDQERLLKLERRKGSIRSAAMSWESAREIARHELELLRCNKRFVEVTLAGLDVTMQQLRH